MQYLKRLIQTLHAHEQRSFLDSILRVVSQKYFSSSPQGWELIALSETPLDIAGAAGLLRDVIAGNDVLTEAFVHLITKSDMSPLVTSQSMRRAVLAVLSMDDGMVQEHLPINLKANFFFDLDRMQDVTEKLLHRFGDQLFVRHAAIVQQEGRARISFSSERI
jgi:telomere length regulation protein